MGVCITHLAGPGDDEIEEFVLRDRTALVYASPRFQQLISRHLGSDAGWLLASRGGVTVAALPYQRADGPYGPVYNSLAYFGSNGGILRPTPDPAAELQLVESFYELAAADGAASATLISNPLRAEPTFYETAARPDVMDVRIGQVTHLPAGGGEAELLACFDSPRPRNIRRAAKAGIVAQESREPWALDFLFDTHAANMAAIGGRAKEREFFKLVPEVMAPTDWVISLAMLEEMPVAGVLLFRYNLTVEYFTPVVVEEYRSEQGLSLAIFSAMKEALADGYAHWNWGGTWTTQQGVYDFKKRWGTSDYEYRYYSRLLRDDVLHCRPEELLAGYPGMYVLPFSRLESVRS